MQLEDGGNTAVSAQEKPKEGEVWKVDLNDFFGLVTSEDPLRIRYYIPRKGKVQEEYYTLDDRVYDIELGDLVKKVPKPKEITVGARRVYYDFSQ